MEILAQILEFLKESYERIIPWFVLRDFEHGVVLRLGKFHRVLDPGLSWKVPLIDEVFEVRKSVTTLNVKPQTLTTLDGKDIVISAVVKYNVSDPRVFLVEVEDAVDAIGDITQGKIKDLVCAKTWDDIKAMKDEELKKLVKDEARRWGVKIHYVTITDLAKIRTIRLMR